ncbi:MAG: hypothetical protein HFH44_10790, partial [Lachnospiraceae bacterium]|nr:hypothetical protein [Lachnospiraceae bacterium]
GMEPGQVFCGICRLGIALGQGLAIILCIGSRLGFWAIGRPGMASRQGCSGIGHCGMFWLQPQSGAV